MYGQKLFDLAKIVGLTPGDMATHLGVPRVYTHRWAHGEREIAAQHLPTIMARLLPAIRGYLDRLKSEFDTLLADCNALCKYRAEHEGLTRAALLDLERAIAAKQAAMAAKRAAQADLGERMAAVFEQTDFVRREATGGGPSAGVAHTLEALETFRSMDPVDLRKMANAQRLVGLAETLLEYGKTLLKLGPLMGLMDEEFGDARNDCDRREDTDPEQPGVDSAHATVLAGAKP